MALDRVNMTMLPLKAGYFFYFAALACMFPYLPVYFVSLGIKVWQVGLLRGIDPILTFIFSPMWGGVADKYSKHRIALMTGIVGTTITYFSFMFVPYITRPFRHEVMQDWTSSTLNETDLVQFACLENSTLKTYPAFKIYNYTELKCLDLCSNVPDPSHSGHHIIGLCTRKITVHWECVTCQSDGQDEYLHNNTMTDNVRKVKIITCEAEDKSLGNWSSSSSVDSMIRGPDDFSDLFDDFDCLSKQVCTCEIAGNVSTASSAHTFILCFILALLANTFDCNILSFIDAAIMDLLGDKERHYGKQRLWGAIGWGSVAFVGGMTVDLVTRAARSAEIRYEPLFVLFAIAMVLLLCCALFVHFPAHQKPKHISRDLLLLSIKPNVLLFILVVTVEGISLGMQYSFVNIYWQTELGASITLLGFSILLTTIAETPVLYFSGRIVQRIGYQGVVYSTLLAYAVRYICYAVIRKPWAVLPVQLLHGITFGIGWPGFTTYANQIAPPGMSATLQSIKSSAHFGGGFIIGNFGGGFIYDNFGPQTLFYGNAGLCVLTGVVFFVTDFVLRERNGNLRSSQGHRLAKSTDVENYDETTKDSMPMDSL